MNGILYFVFNEVSLEDRSVDSSLPKHKSYTPADTNTALFNLPAVTFCDRVQLLPGAALFCLFIRWCGNPVFWRCMQKSSKDGKTQVPLHMTDVLQCYSHLTICENVWILPPPGILTLRLQLPGCLFKIKPLLAASHQTLGLISIQTQIMSELLLGTNDATTFWVNKLMWYCGLSLY